MNVLIADDLSLIRTVLSRTLEKHGVDVIDHAADGLEAMKLLQSKTYHLIITDHYMPHHSGIEVAIEARVRGCVGPIIMQTTEAQKIHVLRALHVGVTDYIVKPYTCEYLYDRLEKHIFKAAMLETEEIRETKRGTTV
ncbi:MAG: response regulator [Pirellulales bacterium]